MSTLPNFQIIKETILGVLPPGFEVDVLMSAFSGIKCRCVTALGDGSSFGGVILLPFYHSPLTPELKAGVVKRTRALLADLRRQCPEIAEMCDRWERDQAPPSDDRFALPLALALSHNPPPQFIDDLIDAFNPNLHSVPLLDPRCECLGWVSALQRHGDMLMAEFDRAQVSEHFFHLAQLDPPPRLFVQVYVLGSTTLGTHRWMLRLIEVRGPLRVDFSAKE